MNRDPSKSTRCGTTSIETIVVITAIVVPLLLGARHLAGYTKDVFEISDENFSSQPHVGEQIVLTPRTETASPLKPSVQEEVVQELSRSLGWVFVFAGGVFLYWNSGRNNVPALTSSKSVVALETDGDDPSSEHVQHSFGLKRRTILKAISENFEAAIQGDITVAQVMTKKPLYLGPEASREEVQEFFEKKRIHHLLIASEGKLLGIMSRHDAKLRSGKVARDMMTCNPITVDLNANVDIVASIMLSHRFDCLPVLKNDNIVGVVTTSDLMVALQCSLRALQSITKSLGVESSC